MTSFGPKMLVDSDRRIWHINSSYLATLLLKLQWHIRIYDQTFHVNSSLNNAKFLKFYGHKIESTRNSNFDFFSEISDSNLESGRYGPKSKTSPAVVRFA